MEQNKRHEKLIIDNRSSHSLYDSYEAAFDCYFQYWSEECPNYVCSNDDFLFSVRTNKDSITIVISDNYVKRDGEDDARNAILDSKILDHHFSVRSLACMKASGIVTVRDLVRHHKTDMLRFRNFGKQSLAELDDFVKSNGLEWGMEV